MDDNEHDELMKAMAESHADEIAELIDDHNEGLRRLNAEIDSLKEALDDVYTAIKKFI